MYGWFERSRVPPVSCQAYQGNRVPSSVVSEPT
jgi:hypothetical protein